MSHGRSLILQEALPRLLRRGSSQSVHKMVERAHAADLAIVFRKLTFKQRIGLFEHIDELEKRADVLCEVDVDIATEVVGSISDGALIEILTEMSSDDAADIVELMEEERRELILTALRQAGEEDVADLAEYDSETAAGIMTPDVFALREETLISEAIHVLQTQSDDLEMPYYLYVTSLAGDLVGVISLRQLVLGHPEDALSAIMETDVVRVDMSTDQEVVARLVARYNLLAIPVVDHANKLVGAVTVDDIIDVIRSEATEDMLKMAGVGEQGVDQASALVSARARLPWLFASFIGGLAAAGLISFFEGAIEKVVPLAAFIPIVLGMGGNVGIQSATIITRGIALGRVDTTRLMRVLLKEIVVATICGVVYGSLLGFLAWGRYSGTDLVSSGLLLGMTVGVAVAAAMIIAGTVGAAIPIIFDRINVDPALASGPFITTTVDVMGIAVYFGIAAVLLGI